MKVRRLLSMIIDMGILFLFEIFLYSLVGQRLFESTNLATGITYFIGITLLAFIQSKWDGQTPGKRIVKLKVVADQGELSFLTYWFRLILAYIFILFSVGILLVVNILLIFIRKDQKTLHDLIVNTHIATR